MPETNGNGKYPTLERLFANFVVRHVAMAGRAFIAVVAAAFVLGGGSNPFRQSPSSAGINGDAVTKAEFAELYKRANLTWHEVLALRREVQAEVDKNEQMHRQSAHENAQAIGTLSTRMSLISNSVQGSEASIDELTQSLRDESEKWRRWRERDGR